MTTLSIRYGAHKVSVQMASSRRVPLTKRGKEVIVALARNASQPLLVAKRLASVNERCTECFAKSKESCRACVFG